MKMQSEIKGENLIKILKMQKIDSLYNIFFDNATTLIVDENDIFNYKLYKDNKITPSVFEKLEAKNSYYLCLNDAIKLMNAKFYAKRQLINKLKSKGYLTDDIIEVVSYLEQIKLVDDNAFYESFVDAKVRQGYGPIYIKNKLFELGIEKNVFIDYKQQFDIIKTKYLKQPFNRYSTSVINKKFRNKMISQGFDSTIIDDVISNVIIEGNSEMLKMDYDKLFLKYSKKYDGYKLEATIKQKLIQKGYLINEIESVMKEG